MAEEKCSKCKADLNDDNTCECCKDKCKKDCECSDDCSCDCKKEEKSEE